MKGGGERRRAEERERRDIEKEVGDEIGDAYRRAREAERAVLAERDTCVYYWRRSGLPE